MSYELIVFDWDGTLMDSESRIVSCLQAAATDLGMAAPVPEQAREVIGLGLAEAVSQLFRVTDPGTVTALSQRYRYYFLGDELAPSSLFQGAREVLTDLEAAGYLLAVATGKSRRGLDKELASTGLGARFHTSRCADETHSKPHPQMLLDILDRLGVEPGAALMVGDTEYDVQMAANAGAPALGVGYGVHAPERLLAHGALHCLDDIRELPGWLESRRVDRRSECPGSMAEGA